MDKKFCTIHNKAKYNNGKIDICGQCQTEKVIDIRIRKKIFLVNHFGGKCKECGYDKCISALTFHHLDPSKKDFTISGTQKSLATLLKEAEKCVLLCRNCHAEVHASPSHFNYKERKITMQTQKKVIKKCAICNNICKKNSSVFCSRECYDENIKTNRINGLIKTPKRIRKIKTIKKIKIVIPRKKIDINDIKSLIEKNKSYSETGRKLGVSSNAILKRVKKELPKLYAKINKEKEPFVKKCKCCNKSFKTRSTRQAFCNGECHSKHINKDYNKYIKKIMQLREKGHSKAEIARKMNIHRRTLTSYIQKHDQTK